MPILDPNIYVPNPANASDAYPPYDRGAELQAYIRDGNDSFYYGVEWPGFSVFPDFITPQAQQFWTEQCLAFHEKLAYDGFWLDVNDATSFCTGSCGQGLREENPIHVPFALPGDPNTSVAVDYRYPEMFNITNATEAASASSAMMSQSIMYPTPSVTPTPTVGRTLATPGVRNLTYPPYAINNFLPGHSLQKQVISPDATHNDGPYNSTEYELHNLYGHTSGNATYNALKAVFPGKRPFFIKRSTFSGSGNFSGELGELCYDTECQADNDRALGWRHQQYVGQHVFRYQPGSTIQHCRYTSNTIAQEAYRWSTTAEATRRIMNIRYSLLPYTYTLFHRANVAGETVLRALPWEFPNDPSLKAVETQFMSGPALLVTPVLTPLATSVQGVFPGIADGTLWYDFYTLQKVGVAAGENKTLDAPLVHQPIHVRGGYVVPMQKAGNTTKTSRLSPWSLIVALDGNGKAGGEVYLDDGISLVPNATKNVEFSFANNTLRARVSGDYQDGISLANITIAGIKWNPQRVSVDSGGESCNTQRARLSSDDGDVLRITGLEQATHGGAWRSNLTVKLH
ncbi:hypothetical protein LTR35_016467 [Friedmanniomyces endolithicus]|nr:hypothetical protein LTR35_016467 [Friedmanniomyces endolithicus]KAK0273997.1 hypothetical protein LTS00_015541 [Friedmanniomyces endolithicus]KAK0978163.1 hypothetical protein LTR54_015975 [Friedmanniomyces endolithicus]